MSDREFDNYLALLTRLLRLRGKQQALLAAELRAHLEDRLEELLARGVSREEAVRRALEEFGDAAGLAGEFVSISRNKRRRWLMRVTTFSVAATVLLATGIAIFWPGRNAAPGVAAVVAQAPAKDPFGKQEPAAGAPQVEAPKAPDSQGLQERLNQRIDVDFVDLPLREVVHALRAKTDSKFYLDVKALETTGITPDSPVTFSMSQIRLSTLLDLMLRTLDLTYLEKDDILIITTNEEAESALVIHVYDCRDLLAMEAPPGSDKFIPASAMRAGGGGFFAIEEQVASQATSGDGAQVPGSGGTPGATSSGLGGGFGMGGQGTVEPVSEHDLRARKLMNIMTTNVDAQSWDEVGGPGSISEYNGLIVVTQTGQVHQKVERVLDMLREAAGIAEPEAGKRKVVR